MSLMQEMNERAAELGVPMGVHLDITYRCNERCVHCYLDHDDHGEMTTAEIKDVLDQLAEAGTFFLTLSGGEVLMRRDFFEILEHARRLLFNVRVKTNGVMIRTQEAQRLRELGVTYTLDPTITPKMDGDTSVLRLRIPGSELNAVFHNKDLVGNVEEFCAPPPPPGEDVMEGYPCSAGHTAAYITPYGDVFPCVQFPLPSGNVRRQKFMDIWRDSPELNEVRSIRAKDLPVCSTCNHVGTCTRCPGLAYMEGSMRGPSTADCEKSFHRTGILTANMLRKARSNAPGPLVQIRLLAV